MKKSFLLLALALGCEDPPPAVQVIDIDEVLKTSPPVVEAEPSKEEPEDDTHELGSFSTTFKHLDGNANRSFNIHHAASKLKNVVLSPGEEFSFNKLVGIRSTSNGFKEAHVIYMGIIEDGVGGGVCQVSSTLNGAVHKAGLLPSFRKGHSRPSEYIMEGLDATVTWPMICETNPSDPNICYKVDYRFKNTYDFPIEIAPHIEVGEEDSTLKISILGEKPIDTKYDVVSYFKEANGFQIRYRRGKLKGSEKKQIQRGSKGKIATLRVKAIKGEEVLSTHYYRSLYRPVDEVWEVGPHYPLPEEKSWESSSSTPKSRNPLGEPESTPNYPSAGTDQTEMEPPLPETTPSTSLL